MNGRGPRLPPTLGGRNRSPWPPPGPGPPRGRAPTIPPARSLAGWKGSIDVGGFANHHLKTTLKNMEKSFEITKKNLETWQSLGSRFYFIHGNGSLVRTCWTSVTNAENVQKFVASKGLVIFEYSAISDHEIQV